MLKSRIEREKDLFLRVLEIELEARIEFLSRACGDDVELLERLKSLIATADGASRLFEKPAWSPLVGSPALYEMLSGSELLLVLQDG